MGVRASGQVVVKLKLFLAHKLLCHYSTCDSQSITPTILYVIN